MANIRFSCCFVAALGLMVAADHTSATNPYVPVAFPNGQTPGIGAGVISHKITIGKE